MAKLTLKEMVLNDINSKKFNASELAVIAKYSSGESFKKPLKKPEKEFDNFFGWLKVVDYMYKKEANTYLAEFALTLHPNKQSARFMLEYCDLNGLTETRKSLIDCMVNCSNSQSQEWAEIHKIDYLYLNKEISFIEAIHKYGELTPKSTEMKIYISILKAYCYLDEQMYDMVYQLIQGLEMNIESLDKDEYMYHALMGRHKLLLAECYSRKDEIVKAREVCIKLINENEIQTWQAWGRLHLGNSYIFENYELANNYLLEGYELSTDLTENTRTNLKRSLVFLDNVWKKQPRYINLESTHPSDLHEIAFYYINHSQFNKANEVLDLNDINNLSKNQLGFHYYLRGLISKEKATLCKSVKFFKLSGDRYYRKLPLLELQRLNHIDECDYEIMSM